MMPGNKGSGMYHINYIALLTLLSVVCLSAADAAGAAEQKKEKPAVGQQHVGASSAPAAGPAADVPVRPPVPVSVLDRFRSYTGLRTPHILSELFKVPVAAEFKQKPDVVLTTGAEALTITARIPVSDGGAPNIAFSGARGLSYTRVGREEWLIEAMPDAGTIKAEMILMTGAGMLEIPLTVSPPVPEWADISEAGFAEFLKIKDHFDPGMDLNGDGQVDYQDTYMYTANYLVRKQTGTLGKPPAKRPVSGDSGPVPAGDAVGQENVTATDGQQAAGVTPTAEAPPAAPAPDFAGAAPVAVVPPAAAAPVVVLPSVAPPAVVPPVVAPPAVVPPAVDPPAVVPPPSTTVNCQTACSHITNKLKRDQCVRQCNASQLKKQFNAIGSTPGQ